MTEDMGTVDHYAAKHPEGFTDYSSGSTHPDCPGDTDLCPDNGCKRCQGPMYDNRIRGRIDRGR